MILLRDAFWLVLAVGLGAVFQAIFELSLLQLAILAACMIITVMQSWTDDTVEPEPDPPDEDLAETDGDTTAPALAGGGTVQTPSIPAGIDLDTTPVSQTDHRPTSNQYPNPFIADIPAIRQLFDQIPDEIGEWRAVHEFAPYGRAYTKDEVTPLLRWITESDVARHDIIVQSDSPDTPYEVFYVFNDRTISYDDPGDQFLTETHRTGLDTAKDAVTYAIHWMQTYPEGGPAPELTMDNVPDPANAPTLEAHAPAYGIQTDPTTGTTTIARRGDT